MKTPKATIDLTGKSIKQIMDLEIDINKLSRGDLSRVVGRLVSASNKRIRNLARSDMGQLSPAYQSRMERGGEFSTKGLTTNQLRQLFAETKGFLNLKTSSVSKWKEVRNEIIKESGIVFDSVTKEKKFWKTYRELTDGKNIPKGKRSSYGSERIQEMLAERFSQKGGFKQKRSDIVNDLSSEIDKLYEQEQEKIIKVIDGDDGIEI